MSTEERVERERPITIDISDGLIYTEAGIWTAKGLAEWMTRLEAKLDAFLSLTNGRAR